MSPMPSSVALLGIVLITMAGIFARWREVERGYREQRDRAERESEM